MIKRAPPGFGQLVPQFVASTDVNPRFHFETMAGHWVVLMFFGSLANPVSAEAHARILARRALFDDKVALFWGVSVDPADQAERGLAASPPGVRYFWDFQRLISEGYGVAGDGVHQPTVFLLDRHLRVVSAAPVQGVDAILDRLEAELRAEESAAPAFAPVLTLPRVFEPELCRELIAHYESTGGEPSGFMQAAVGRTLTKLDDKVKRRRDAHLPEGELKERTRAAVGLRLFASINRAFGWRATRIERFVVARYGSEDGGFFSPHRDNTTTATRHRKFAVSINLNDDFEGGELRFPEFGSRTYKPPLGGATVFSCSLMHEATPVTRGVRYAFLPFLYDEEGKKIREESAATIVPLEPKPEPAQA